jgi:hypothetical protein
MRDRSMQQCLIDYVNDYNTRAKPFTWTWNAKTTSPDSNVTGTVALTDRLARPTVDTPDVRSDQGGELIKRGRDAQTFMTGFDPEFVMAASQVLDERVTADHRRRGPIRP